MIISKIFSSIEGASVTINAWITTLFGIIIVRTFLENFSGLRVDSAITTNIHALIHFSIYWIVMVVLLTLILHLGTKKDIKTVSKVTLYGAVLITLAPIIGFILSKGQGLQMTYSPFNNMAETINNFVSVYFANPVFGVTVGMRLEVIIILIVSFLYVRYSGLNLLKSFMTTLFVYLTIFISGILPSLLSVDSSYSWVLKAQNTLVGSNLIHPMFEFNSFVYKYETFFDVTLSHALYLVLLPGLLFIFLRCNKAKTLAVLKNSRPERVTHYLSMIGVGIFLAFYNNSNIVLTSNWLNVSSTLILFLSFYFAWMYAIGINDIVDYDSDKLTNKKRPLVTKLISISEMKQVSHLFLALALLGGYLVGPEIFVFVLVSAALSYVYSCPPLHLKRYAIINPFVVSLASLSAIMAGYFTFSRDVAANSFPASWIVITVVIYTLLANIKDIKDIEGDKKVGVYTIPVLFGEKKGKRIIFGLVGLGLMFITILLGGGLFWVPTIAGLVLTWYIFESKEFNDKKLFVLYFLYFLSIAFVYFIN